MNTDHAHNACY